MNNFDQESEKIRERNSIILDGFITDMESKGLSIKTQRKHLFNIEFFINEFILRMDLYTPESGWFMIDEYLSYFYINKCCWSTIPNMKLTITSFKKFYLYLEEMGLITSGAYSELLLMIKDNKDEWLEGMKRADEAGDYQFYDIL